MFKDYAQPNTQNDQEKPTSEKLYVILPGHPFYGYQVKIIGRRSADTYTLCTIENPHQPDFHHQLPERWLAGSPPPAEPTTAATQRSICLSLTALDKMVQMILTRSQQRKDGTNPQPIGRHNCSDLGADTSPSQSSTQPSTLLPGPQTDRRER